MSPKLVPDPLARPPAPALPPQEQSMPPPPGRSPPLWRELADGSAGPAVRVVVSVALAPLLAGLACFASFVVAGIIPGPGLRGRAYLGPSDELVGCMLGLSSVAYLAALVWLWTRRRWRAAALWRAALLTLAAVALVTVLCVVVSDTRLLRGGEEVLIAALVCMAAGAVILIWLQSVRAYLRGKPPHDPTDDGVPDVRCPSCGYRMVGLRESRCPECGTVYTIDELLARQEFLIRRPLPPPLSARDRTARSD